MVLYERSGGLVWEVGQSERLFRGPSDDGEQVMCVQATEVVHRMAHREVKCQAATRPTCTAKAAFPDTMSVFVLTRCQNLRSPADLVSCNSQALRAGTEKEILTLR